MKRSVVLTFLFLLSAPGAGAPGTAVASAGAPVATGARVSVGSPPGHTPRNHVNEPAVAVDAHNPDFLVAGGGHEELTGTDQTIAWSGIVWGTSSPDAPTTETGCQNLPTAVAQVGTSSFAGKVCDGFALEINLPANVWSTPGGVQIAIKWEDPTSETIKDIDLFVFDSAGELVGKSEGWASEAEAVTLPSLANGEYVVVAARDSVFDLAAEELPYEGMAQVEYFPAVEPVRDLLPDLYPLPIPNIEFRTGAYLFLTPESASSCYPEETLEQGARKCMRFNQGAGNKGEGPFELRYNLPPESASLPLEPTDDLPPDHASTAVELRSLSQRIYRSDGTKRDHDAGTFTFHPTHAHVHYTGFAQSRLYFSNEDGSRGALAGTGKKNGFCLADMIYPNFGLTGDTITRAYKFPVECNRPNEVDPQTGKTYLVNGITNGWADNYVWFLADQFIEVSGRGDGYYVIETSIGGDEIVEMSSDNNCSATLIRLMNMNQEMSTGEIIRDLGDCEK